MDLEEKSLAEITIKAVVLGVLLSMILAAANAYLGTLIWVCSRG
jgi:uncharacterized oligopeptide transporter (OPT) family protein